MQVDIDIPYGDFSLGDPADRLEVTGGGDREARLDDVHVERRQLPGDLDLLEDRC